MYYKIFEHSYSSTLQQSNSRTLKHLQTCTPNHSTFTSTYTVQEDICCVCISLFFLRISFSTVPPNVQSPGILSLISINELCFTKCENNSHMSKQEAINVPNTHFSPLIFSMFQVQCSIGQSATCDNLKQGLVFYSHSFTQVQVIIKNNCPTLQACTQSTHVCWKLT